MHEETSIVDIIKSRLDAESQGVPVFNKVAVRLQQVLAQPDFKMETVLQLISADPGLASQVLRVANSAFYKGLSSVATVKDAIVRLGAKEVANLAMLTTQQELHRSEDPRYQAMMQTLWKHSYCCAVGSRWLAAKAGYADLAQEAFLAGLLHDIGKLFLLKVTEQLGKEEGMAEAITPAILGEVLDSLHVEQGYFLMQKWHMPQMYCDAVQHHEGEQWPQGNPLVAMVRLANLTCRRLGIGMHEDAALVLFASGEAHVLGLQEIAVAELEIAVEDALSVPMSSTT